MSSTGWCYIDPAQGFGSPEFVAACPETEKRAIRFSNDALSSASIFTLSCVEHSVVPALGPDRAGLLGDACTPSEEANSNFSGFATYDASIEIGSRQCGSGLCLQNHFNGRVSCPYGQTQYEVDNGPLCWLPGAVDQPVIVPVDPQFTARRGADTVHCSCRCAGPGPGPFCSCAADETCTPMIDDLGIAPGAAIAGSYCIKQGFSYDPTHIGEQCSRALQNCN